MNDDNLDKAVLNAITKIGKFVLVFALLAYLLFNVTAWVGAGQRGVIMDFGKVRADTILDPGVHLVVPFYNSVVMMDVQTQVVETSMSAASKDLQSATTLVAVNYHLAPDSVSTVYRDIGIDYRTKVIAPAIQDIGKTATASFSAEELINKRPSVREKFQADLSERMLPRGILIEQVSLTDFAFGAEFTKTIEAKVTAQQLFQKAEFDLQRITIEAKQKVAQAEGEKQATILIAEGRAKEVEIIQRQLTQSPQYINYMAVRSWNGVLPMVTGSGGIPLIQLPTTVTAK